MSGERLRVVDVTEFWSLRGGGVRSHLTTKARELVQRDVQHTILAPGPAAARAELARAGQARSELVTVPGPRLPYDPTYHALWRLDLVTAALARSRADVVEINSPYGAALSVLAARLPRRTVRTLFWHADFIDTYVQPALARRFPGAVERWCRAKLWRLVRRLTARCHATLVTSRCQFDKLAEHGVPRLVLVPFGVDKSLFSPALRNEALRERLLRDTVDGAQRAEFLAVAVGRLAIEKSWPLVIEALAALPAPRRVRLLFLGDGPERARLERLAERASLRVHFEGFVSDRARYAELLASADLMVHACPYETFGLSVAEAAASGVPALVPDQGGAAELRKTDVVETFRAGSSEDCSAALLRLLGELAGRRERARAHALEVRAQSAHFDDVLDLYRQLSPAP